MKSFNFPNMLSSANANIIENTEATISNFRLLLASWKTSLFGDPYFGTNIKRFIYEQNNIILRDLIIDDIVLAIHDFMPQIYVERKNIFITIKNQEVYVTINCINKLDNEATNFTINLMEDN